MNIKPCAFCGAIPEQVTDPYDSPVIEHERDCFLEGQSRIFYDRIRAWNTRATPKVAASCALCGKKIVVYVDPDLPRGRICASCEEDYGHKAVKAKAPLPTVPRHRKDKIHA